MTVFKFLHPSNNSGPSSTKDNEFTEVVLHTISFVEGLFNNFINDEQPMKTLDPNSILVIFARI